MERRAFLAGRGAVLLAADNFRFHDCRHHFASWFVMRGGSLAALKALLGHSNFQMTLRYAHLAPDHLRAEMLKTESTADSSAQDQHTASHTALPAPSTLISSGASI